MVVDRTDETFGGVEGLTGFINFEDDPMAPDMNRQNNGNNFMTSGEDVMLTLNHKIKPLGALFMLFLFVMPQFAFGQSFSEILTDNLKIITSFEPGAAPNNLNLDGFQVSTKEVMIARIEKSIKEEESKDQIFRLREYQKYLGTLEYSKNLNLISKKNSNVFASLGIEKFDQSNGGDEILELQYSRFEDSYRVFGKKDFLQCRANYEILRESFGDPDAVRDLVSDSTLIPYWFTDSPNLSAEWVKGETVIYFNCRGFIESQWFFEDSENFSGGTDEEKISIQAALSFFGFSSDSTDESENQSSLLALRNYQGCIKAMHKDGILDQKQFRFLVDSYEDLSNETSKSSCDQLQEIVPRKLMSMHYSVKVSKRVRSIKMNDIMWLQCLRTSHVARFLSSGNTIETEPNDMVTFGIDVEDGILYGGLSRNVISENLAVTDSVFQVIFSMDSDEDYYDMITTDLSIDRMTGALTTKQEFLKNGKIEVRSTDKYKCSKVDRKLRKF